LLHETINEINPPNFSLVYTVLIPYILNTGYSHIKYVLTKKNFLYFVLLSQKILALYKTRLSRFPTFLRKETTTFIQYVLTKKHSLFRTTKSKNPRIIQDKTLTISHVPSQRNDDIHTGKYKIYFIIYYHSIQLQLSNTTTTYTLSKIRTNHANKLA
jgi:hypothetical protein